MHEDHEGFCKFTHYMIHPQSSTCLAFCAKCYGIHQKKSTISTTTLPHGIGQIWTKFPAFFHIVAAWSFATQWGAFSPFSYASSSHSTPVPIAPSPLLCPITCLDGQQIFHPGTCNHLFHTGHDMFNHVTYVTISQMKHIAQHTIEQHVLQI